MSWPETTPGPKCWFWSLSTSVYIYSAKLVWYPCQINEAKHHTPALSIFKTLLLVACIFLKFSSLDKPILVACIFYTDDSFLCGDGDRKLMYYEAAQEVVCQSFVWAGLLFLLFFQEVFLKLGRDLFKGELVSILWKVTQKLTKR